MTLFAQFGFCRAPLLQILCTTDIDIEVDKKCCEVVLSRRALKGMLSVFTETITIEPPVSLKLQVEKGLKNTGCV